MAETVNNTGTRALKPRISVTTKAGAAPAWWDRARNRLNSLGQPTGLGNNAPVPNFNTPASIAQGQAAFRAQGQRPSLLDRYVSLFNGVGDIGQPMGLGNNAPVPNFYNPQRKEKRNVQNIADGPVVDPQAEPGGYGYRQGFGPGETNGKYFPYPNAMLAPLDDGSGNTGFGTNYGGNWRGGGGGGGGWGSSLPAWYLNLINWNIK